MSRTRQVFPRDTVAHMWAHRAQDSARDSSGNFFFNGPTLYSYGSHFAIAHILSEECGPDLAGRVLWNDATYSNTTSKMQSIAWRALTRQQRDDVLRMPSTIGMGRNVDPHNIDRALREKRLPDVAPLLIARVVECIAQLPRKKRDGGPFCELIREARKAETLAQSFYKRAGRKYPLPAIGDIPTDKPAFLAWVKGYASTKMRADYAAKMAEAKHYADQARTSAAECGDGFPYVQHAPGCQWEARNVVAGTYDAAQRASRAALDAAGIYANLNEGKKSAAAEKIKRDMAPLVALFADRRQEFEKAEKRDRLIYDIRQAALTARSVRQHPVIALGSRRRYFADMESLAERATEYGIDPASVYGLMAARLSRIGAAMSARNACDEMHTEYSAALSFAGRFPGDALRHAEAAIRKSEFIGRLDIADKLRAHLAPKMSDTLARATALRDEMKAAIVARNAETLRAWLSGESNTRPAYEAGTYARMRGDVIETTRGASVPIEHACRLSRLYAVVVRRGGQEWRDGAGPMVGHYRVNKIGADGSLIIGCHEFDAAESARLHALLQACEACAKVTADVA